MYRTILVLISVLFRLTVCGQTDLKLDEDIKVLLFTSKIYDDHTGGFRTSYKKWLELVDNRYNHLVVEVSKRATLHAPNISDSIMAEYQMTLYKLPNDNTENQARYVLSYKDISSDVWLRVGGYVMNDSKLLFDYLKLNLLHLTGH